MLLVLLLDPPPLHLLNNSMGKSNLSKLFSCNSLLLLLLLVVDFGGLLFVMILVLRLVFFILFLFLFPPLSRHFLIHVLSFDSICRAEFCSMLDRLVQLAPPTSAVSDPPAGQPNITNLLQTPLFQSILVTHFHHLEMDDDDEEEEDDDEHRGEGGGLYDDGHEDEEDEIGYGARSIHTYNNNNNNNNKDPPHRHVAGTRVGMEGNGNGDGDDNNDVGDDTNDDNDDNDDEEEESFDPPWPTEHEAFCALPIIQEHVVLEIASGRNSSGATIKPMELPKGKIRVVLPGSLRERGEFCLVDVAFMKDPYHHKADDYRWRVRKTRFQTINEFL